MGSMLAGVCCSDTDCLEGLVGLSSGSNAARIASAVFRLGMVLCVFGAE